MAVFRIEKNKNYTVMANYHLRDISLSLKAKGLLSLMLSLPEGWDYTTKGLACICKDGVDSICSTVKELEKAGYVQRRRLRNELGHLTEIEYTILEKPIRTASSEESTLPDSSAKAGTPPKREKPVLDNPELAFPEQAIPEQEAPEQENPAQLNIQESITEKLNTESRLMEMDVGPLLGLWFQSLFVGICTWAITICIFIVIYGRMIEVYLVTSVAPIPMATMANREWGQMGQNYLRTLFALGFQAFLIMVCVAIYSVLVQNISVSGDISNAIWTCMGYTVLLCFCLFKTSSLARSVFNAH